MQDGARPACVRSQPDKGPDRRDLLDGRALESVQGPAAGQQQRVMVCEGDEGEAESSFVAAL